MSLSYGIHVEKDGTMTLCDKPIFASGYNLFPTFLRHVNTGDEVYKQDLALISSYKVPFVRMPLGVFWPYEWKKYVETPELFFAAMDDVISEAEKQKVGIIASLMWWDPAIADFVGEHRSEMGNPNSKLVAFAKKYVSDVVSRYKDSPAIWGWEIGNEYNLSADLRGKPEYWPTAHPAAGTPESRSDADCITSTQIHDFYIMIGKVIREIDPHRMINTGDGEMREYAWHLRNGDTRETDSFEQFTEMLHYFTPEPLDTVCFHLQHNFMEYDRFGKKGISSYEYFKGFADAAKSLGKGLYYGEFGDMMDWHDLGAMYKNDPELLKKNFHIAVKAIEDAGIPLQSIWMFRYKDGWHEITDGGEESFKFLEVAEMNKRYRARGLQQTDLYWEQF